MAWPTDRRPSDALTGQLVPEIWSAKVIDHLRMYLVADQVISTDWQPMLAKGDILNIPVMAELTGAAVDVTTTGVLTNMNTTVTTTAETITIDTWWEVPVQVDDSTARQTQVANLLEKLADNASYAWRKKLDGDVFSYFSSLRSTWAGTDGQTFTDDLLLSIMEGLDNADIGEERALVCDPSAVADMRKIDKFMTFDYSTNPLRMAGYRGRIDAYGLPVFMTTNLTDATTGSYGGILNKEAIGMIVQSPLDVEKWREEKRHSWIVNSSGFFGIDVLRASPSGAYFYTRKKAT